MRRTFFILSVIFIMMMSSSTHAAPVQAQPRDPLAAQTLRCEKRTARISTHIAQLQKNHTKRFSQLQTSKVRLVDFMSKSESRKADVTKLRADLAIVESDLAKVTSTYEIYLAKLQALKGTACTEGFSTSLRDTRDAQRAMVGAVTTLRTYIQSTVHPDIQAVKKILTTAVKK